MAYGVMSIPTLLVFKNGQPVDRIVGYQPKPQLSARLQRHLA
jgi:thioredoxin 1